MTLKPPQQQEESAFIRQAYSLPEPADHMTEGDCVLIAKRKEKVRVMLSDSTICDWHVHLRAPSSLSM